MPPGSGGSDYDVVIGARMVDDTEEGSRKVRNSIEQLTQDVRRSGERQAREFARASRDIFGQTESHLANSASSMTRRIVQVFDSNNFLLRNLARQAGFTTGAIALGVGKLALSYQKLGDSVGDAGVRSKMALGEVKSAIDLLGVDKDAFRNALRGAKELEQAYKDGGKSAGAAAILAGNALETAVYQKVQKLTRGLAGAEKTFEGLRSRGTEKTEALREKVNEVANSVSHLLGGVPVDAAFFKVFTKAKDDAERYRLVLDKLGPTAALKLSENQVAVNKLTEAWGRLESRLLRTTRSQSDRLADAANRVKSFRTELDSVQDAIKGGKIANLGSEGEAAAAGIGEATGALGGMSAATVGVIAVVGAAVAAIVALIAIVGVFTLMSWKGASAAGAYGDEIYKLEMSTGLSAKTLSTLTVVARESGVQVDSLARTFSRMQIEIDRGLNKPTSEAGRALRTLNVDFENLRKSSPDKQVFTVAAAIEKLNNQNVRAHVSSALLSKDHEHQSEMLSAITRHWERATEKAKRYGLELDESGAVKAHKYTVATQDLKLAWDGLWIRLGEQILPQLTGLIDQLTDHTSGWGNAFTSLGEIASKVLFEIRVQMELMALTWNNPAGKNNVTAPFVYAYEAFAHRGDIVKKLRAEDAQRQKEMEEEAEYLRKRGVQGDDRYAPGQGQKTDLDRLREQVRKLRFELEALQKTSGEDFTLRFELEDLQKAKGFYESIFKLRQEMGLDMSQPFPRFRVRGTQAEQVEDMQALMSYVRGMEQMKKVFDDVRKVANEQGDALTRLAVAQATQMLPVVNAATRAEIKFYEASRARRDAEQELTAEVMAESRIRAEIVQDEVGSQIKAYMTLNRDLGRASDQRRSQLQEDLTFLQSLGRTPAQEQSYLESIKERAGFDTEPVSPPSELAAIASHAATIDKNVAAIAEKVGAAGVAPAPTVAATAISNPRLAALGIPEDAQEQVKIPMYANGQLQGYDTPVSQSKRYPGAYVMGDGTIIYPDGRKPSSFKTDDTSNYTGAFARTEYRVKNEDGSWSIVNSKDFNSPSQTQSSVEEQDMVVRTDHSAVPQLGQRIRDQYAENASGNRVHAVRVANEQILQAQADLNEQLVDYDTDYLRDFMGREVARRNTFRETQKAIELSETDLRTLSDQDSKRYQQVWAEADKSRLEGHVRLKEEIIGLENEILHNGEDTADQMKAARLRAIREVQQADTNAAASQVRSQVQLADQTILHTERVRAAVMDHVVGQGGITDAVTEAFTGTMDALAEGMNQLFGTVNKHLGFMSGFITSIETRLLRMVSDRLIMNLLNVLMGGGSGGGGGMVSGGTPPFAGGSGSAGGLLNLGTGLLASGGLSAPSIATGTGGPLTAAQQVVLASQSTGTRMGQNTGILSMLRSGLGGMLPALGVAAPFLGLSLGSGLGGSSAAGRGLGMAGGAIAGGFGLAAVAATGAFGLGGIGPGLAFLAAAPWLAPVAGALLIGAHLLSVNAQRRKDETARNTVSNDTGTAIWNLIGQAQSPRGLSVADAISRWNDIDQNYHQQIAQLKDSKTKRNAEKQWTQDFMPLRAILLQNAKESEERQGLKNRMSPEFANGGFSWMGQLAKVRPGEGVQYPGSTTVQMVSGHDRGYDSEYKYLPKGARVYTRNEMANAEPHATGGFVGQTVVTRELVVPESVELTFDKDGVAEMVFSHPKFGKVVVNKVREKAKSRGI